LKRRWTKPPSRVHVSDESISFAVKSMDAPEREETLKELRQPLQHSASDR
jgi:hypothetical protein